jgi:hypothetical protein
MVLKVEVVPVVEAKKALTQEVPKQTVAGSRKRVPTKEHSSSGRSEKDAANEPK